MLQTFWVTDAIWEGVWDLFFVIVWEGGFTWAVQLGTCSQSLFLRFWTQVGLHEKNTDSKYWKKYSDSKYTYNLHFHSSSPEQEQKQKMTIIGHQHMTSLSLQQQIQCKKKAKRTPYASFLIEKWRNRAKDLKPIRSSTKTAQTMFTFRSI